MSGRQSRATATFHVVDPETQEVRIFYGPKGDKKGDRVPAHIAAISANVVDYAPPSDDSTREVTQSQAAIDEGQEQAVREVLTHITLAAQGEGEDADITEEAKGQIDAICDWYFRDGDDPLTEGDAEDDDQAGEGDNDPGDDDEDEDEGSDLFDPTEQNAKPVYDHLDALDLHTEAGRAEWERVVALEQAGQNRSTAIPKRDDADFEDIEDTTP